MAELEEVIEIGEEVGEEVGEEAAEGATEEAVAEEVEEARNNVGRLRGCMNTLKEINWGQVVKKFVTFVAKNAAAGSIFWGVTVLLNKTTATESSGEEKKAIQKKQKKVTALAQLTSDISNCFKNLAHWMEEKKDVTVDAGDGIMVPLPDVFTKYTKPLEKVSVSVKVITLFMCGRNMHRRPFYTGNRRFHPPVNLATPLPATLIFNTKL